MLCPKCKNPIDYNETVCSWCEAELKNNIPENKQELKNTVVNSPKPKRKKRIWIIIILLAIGIVYIYKNAGKEETPIEQDGIIKLDSLYVYPEDIGEFEYKRALEICKIINQQKKYGYDDWRLPTISELQLIYNNKEKLRGTNKMQYYGKYLSQDSVKYRDGSTLEYAKKLLDFQYNTVERYASYHNPPYVRLVRTNE